MHAASSIGALAGILAPAAVQREAVLAGPAGAWTGPTSDATVTPLEFARVAVTGAGAIGASVGPPANALCAFDRGRPGGGGRRGSRGRRVGRRAVADHVVGASTNHSAVQVCTFLGRDAPPGQHAKEVRAAVARARTNRPTPIEFTATAIPAALANSACIGKAV